METARGLGAAPGHSPVGSSRGHGAVAQAIRSVEDQVLVLKGAAERRTGRASAAGRPAMPSLVQHCAALLTRCAVGDDERTARDRLKGKPFSEKIAPFGESCPVG